MKKVSVIIPVYKVENFLVKCVDSILNQDYKNIEIILVDDGSPDKCPQICEDYKKNNSNVKVIHKKNGGLSSARNVGISNATGDYFVLVDSDDYIEKNMISKLVENIEQTDADISICNYFKDFEDKTINENGFLSNKVVNKEEIFEYLYNDYYILTIVAWNKIYKKELFKNIEYPEGKIHEDEYIIHNLLANCNKISYLNEQLYHYVQREGSIMTSFSENRFDFIEALENRYNYFLSINNKNLASKTQIRLFNSLLFLMCNLKNNGVHPKYQNIINSKQKYLKKLSKKIIKDKSIKDVKVKVKALSMLVSPKLAYKLILMKRKEFLA